MQPFEAVAKSTAGKTGYFTTRTLRTYPNNNNSSTLPQSSTQQPSVAVPSSPQRKRQTDERTSNVSPPRNNLSPTRATLPTMSTPPPQRLSNRLPALQHAQTVPAKSSRMATEEGLEDLHTPRHAVFAAFGTGSPLPLDNPLSKAKQQQHAALLASSAAGIGGGEGGAYHHHNKPITKKAILDEILQTKAALGPNHRMMVQAIRQQQQGGSMMQSSQQESASGGGKGGAFFFQRFSEIADVLREERHAALQRIVERSAVPQQPPASKSGVSSRSGPARQREEGSSSSRDMGVQVAQYVVPVTDIKKAALERSQTFPLCHVFPLAADGQPTTAEWERAAPAVVTLSSSLIETAVPEGIEGNWVAVRVAEGISNSYLPGALRFVVLRHNVPIAESPSPSLPSAGSSPKEQPPQAIANADDDAAAPPSVADPAVFLRDDGWLFLDLSRVDRSALLSSSTLGSGFVTVQFCVEDVSEVQFAEANDGSLISTFARSATHELQILVVTENSLDPSSHHHSPAKQLTKPNVTAPLNQRSREDVGTVLPLSDFPADESHTQSRLGKTTSNTRNAMCPLAFRESLPSIPIASYVYTYFLLHPLAVLRAAEERCEREIVTLGMGLTDNRTSPDGDEKPSSLHDDAPMGRCGATKFDVEQAANQLLENIAQELDTSYGGVKNSEMETKGDRFAQHVQEVLDPLVADALCAFVALGGATGLTQSHRLGELRIRLLCDAIGLNEALVSPNEAQVTAEIAKVNQGSPSSDVALLMQYLAEKQTLAELLFRALVEYAHVLKHSGAHRLALHRYRQALLILCALESLEVGGTKSSQQQQQPRSVPLLKAVGDVLLIEGRCVDALQYYEAARAVAEVQSALQLGLQSVIRRTDSVTSHHSSDDSLASRVLFESAAMDAERSVAVCLTLLSQDKALQSSLLRMGNFVQAVTSAPSSDPVRHACLLVAAEALLSMAYCVLAKDCFTQGEKYLRDLFQLLDEREAGSQGLASDSKENDSVDDAESDEKILKTLRGAAALLQSWTTLRQWQLAKASAATDETDDSELHTEGNEVERERKHAERQTANRLLRELLQTSHDCAVNATQHLQSCGFGPGTPQRIIAELLLAAAESLLSDHDEGEEHGASGWADPSKRIRGRLVAAVESFTPTAALRALVTMAALHCQHELAMRLPNEEASQWSRAARRTALLQFCTFLERDLSSQLVANHLFVFTLHVLCARLSTMCIPFPDSRRKSSFLTPASELLTAEFDIACTQLAKAAAIYKSVLVTPNSSALRTSTAAPFSPFLRRDVVLWFVLWHSLSAHTFAYRSMLEEWAEKPQRMVVAHDTPLHSEEVESLSRMEWLASELPLVQSMTSHSLKLCTSLEEEQLPPFTLPLLLMDSATLQRVGQDNVSALDLLGKALRASDDRNLLFLLGPLYRPSVELTTVEIEDRNQLMNDRKPSIRTAVQMAQVLYLMGSVHERTGSPIQAKKLFLQAYATHEMLNILEYPIVTECLVAAARASLVQGDYGEANTLLDFATESFFVHHHQFGRFRANVELLLLRRSIDSTLSSCTVGTRQLGYTLLEWEQVYTAPALGKQKVLM